MSAACFSALLALLAGVTARPELGDRYFLYSGEDQPTDVKAPPPPEKRVLPQWFWLTSRPGTSVLPQRPLLPGPARDVDTKRERPSYHPMTRFRFWDDIGQRFVQPLSDDDRIKKGLSAGELMTMLRGVAQRKGVMGRLKGMRFGIGRR